MSSRCRYEDAEGENKSYAHNITELLRSLADIGDSKNAEAKVLEDELEAEIRSSSSGGWHRPLKTLVLPRNR